MIWCCNHNDCWGLVGGVIGLVYGVVGIIVILLEVWQCWICGFIFIVSLCVGECGDVGAVGAVGVVTHIVAASVVSLQILLSCSNVWRCLDGFIAFPLFSLIVLTSSSSAICVKILWLDLWNVQI